MHSIKTQRAKTILTPQLFEVCFAVSDLNALTQEFINTKQHYLEQDGSS